MPGPHSIRERRRAAGQCLFCGGVRKPGVLFCTDCLVAQAERDRARTRRRCKVCRKQYLGTRSACAACLPTLERMAAARGPVPALATRLPGRSAMIDEYARRAALGLPLFE
jgi:hypothetical protein